MYVMWYQLNIYLLYFNQSKLCKNPTNKKICIKYNTSKIVYGKFEYIC